MSDIVGHDNIAHFFADEIEHIRLGEIQMTGPRVVLILGPRGTGKRSAVLQTELAQNDIPTLSADGGQDSAVRMGVFVVTPLTTLADIMNWYDSGPPRIMPCILLSYLEYNQYIMSGQVAPPVNQQGGIIHNHTNWVKNIYSMFAATGKSVHIIITSGEPYENLRDGGPEEMTMRKSKYIDTIRRWTGCGPGRFINFESEYYMSVEDIAGYIEMRGVSEMFSRDHYQKMAEKEIRPASLVNFIDGVIVQQPDLELLDDMVNQIDDQRAPGVIAATKRKWKK